MNDRESELIERLMQGDMEAFDELMPNARPEDRYAFEKSSKVMREIKESPTIKLWMAWVLYLFGKTFNHNDNEIL